MFVEQNSFGSDFSGATPDAHSSDLRGGPLVAIS